jgi:hypothetical protein
VAGEIDYSKHTEAELVEMFGRMDPRFAPVECARLGKLLTELGYVVTQGDTEPGSAEPSAAKLQALIGSRRPFGCNVDFGKVTGPFSYLEPTHNELGFVGPGELQTDGVSVYLSGRAAPPRATYCSPNVVTLDHLQDISDRRAQAFQLLDAGLRSNDPKVIASAGQQLQQVDQIVTQRSQTR